MHVNNIKKEWGRRKLRALLMRTTSETTNALKDSLNALKKDWQEGRDKKMKQCRRTINTDVLFTASAFHTWRHKEVTGKHLETVAVKQIAENKINSLTKIASVNSAVTNSKLKDVIHKFRLLKEQKAKRINGIQQKFMGIVNRNKEWVLR
jgi:alpha-N-acetylglucosamine transferase